jgi:hypothetical protein
MGNAALPSYRRPLETLAANEDPVIASHARWALQQIEWKNECA